MCRCREFQSTKRRVQTLLQFVPLTGCSISHATDKTHSIQNTQAVAVLHSGSTEATAGKDISPSFMMSLSLHDYSTFGAT